MKNSTKMVLCAFGAIINAGLTLVQWLYDADYVMSLACAVMLASLSLIYWAVSGAET